MSLLWTSRNLTSSFKWKKLPWKPWLSSSWFRFWTVIHGALGYNYCHCGSKILLMEGSWWESDWGGNWVLFWWVGSMISKSLIQISVDGWSCVPSLLFTFVQAMVEVMKIMATSINMSHACTATVSAPSLLSMPLLTHASTGHYWKNMPAIWEMWVQSPGWEDSLEIEMATHSTILA